MVRPLLFALALSVITTASPSDACCPAPPGGKPVVNADQTVILVWDKATKTEHFIRRASFKSEAQDFGFLVPTPAQPELEESGDAAFPLLAKLTEPKVVYRAKPMECSGCLTRSKSAAVSAAPPESVRVLEEKTVAGFHASVLEAKSETALTAWLKEHGYAFSPEVEAWAKPYVDGGWKITALRVAKPDPGARVSAASLRLSFKTDTPLFPYREPDTSKAAPALAATHRMLRIYFVGDARYEGALGAARWSGEAAWSGKIPADKRGELVSALKLPDAAMPRDAWLTEFEDDWPYRVAPADLTFTHAAKQDTLEREPVIRYTANARPDGVSFGGLALVPFVFGWRRRQRTSMRTGRPSLP